MTEQNLPSKLLTAQQLDKALRTGDLFNIYNEMAALRAWAHVNRHDAAVAAIVNKKSFLFNTSSFTNWVDILTVVNNYLLEPVKPAKSQQDATLLDYLILEEQIIAKYINQVNSRIQFSGLHSPPRHVINSVADGYGGLVQFFRHFPEYIRNTSEEHAQEDALLWEFLAQPEQSRLSLYDWQETYKNEHAPYPSKTGPTLFFLIASALTVYLTHSSNISGISETPLVLFDALGILFALYFAVGYYGAGVSIHENTELNLSDRMQVHFQRNFLRSIISWNGIIKSSSQTFEDKFLLRAYFNMMHSEPLYNVASFQNSLRMDFTHMSPEDFGALAILCTYSRSCPPDQTIAQWLFRDAELVTLNTPAPPLHVKRRYIYE